MARVAPECEACACHVQPDLFVFMMGWDVAITLLGSDHCLCVATTLRQQLRAQVPRCLPPLRDWHPALLRAHNDLVGWIRKSTCVFAGSPAMSTKGWCPSSRGTFPTSVTVVNPLGARSTSANFDFGQLFFFDFGQFSTSANFRMLSFWTTKGGAPKSGGPNLAKMGPWAGSPQFRAFFPSPATVFALSFSLSEGGLPGWFSIDCAQATHVLGRLAGTSCVPFPFLSSCRYFNGSSNFFLSGNALLVWYLDGSVVAV